MYLMCSISTNIWITFHMFLSYLITEIFNFGTGDQKKKNKQMGKGRVQISIRGLEKNSKLNKVVYLVSRVVALKQKHNIHIE